jgi:hypothetical protein
MDNGKTQNKVKFYKKWWFWTVIGVIAVIMIASNGSTNNKDTSGNNGSSQSTQKEETPAEQTRKSKLMTDILALVGEGKAFDTGSHAAGQIPVGEYAFIPISSGSNYYSEKDASGNIVDNENFSSFGWVYVNGVGNIETRGVLVKAGDFAVLGVTSAKEMYIVLNDMATDYNQGGYYKVGVDLPAGKYRLSSIGGSGYVSINSGGVGKSTIIDNESFDGSYDISVSDGQFISLSRASISLLE